MADTILTVPPLQAVGLLGAALYILNYVLLTSRLLNSENVSYFVLNMAAAILVLISLAEAFNAASLLIQIFFVCSSFVGAVLRVGRIGRARPVDRLGPIR